LITPQHIRAFSASSKDGGRFRRALQSPQEPIVRALTTIIYMDPTSDATPPAAFGLVTHVLTTSSHTEPDSFIENHQSRQSFIGHGHASTRAEQQDQQPAEPAQI